jgi:hypothetical protein
MLHYRAYLLDNHHHVISAANLYCVDEQSAKENIQQLVDTNDMELWLLDRRIAVFESHVLRDTRAAWQSSTGSRTAPAPIPVHDRQDDQRAQSRLD